jgi:hypothetical protein
VTVYKYPMRVTMGMALMRLPARAVLLSVQKQDERPCLWALVSPHQPAEDRWFRWYGTGYDIDLSESPVYVGTVQHEPYVWHLFEVRPAGSPPSEEEPKSRYHFDAGRTARHLEDVEETAEEHANRVIK